MVVAQKAQSTEQELTQVQERLQALNAEHAGLSSRAREAMAVGDERAFIKARERGAAIPRESYALQVRSLKLELQHAKERQAAVAETLPGLATAYERAAAALQAAQDAHTAAMYAHNEARNEERELRMQVRDIERHRLPALLARAGTA